MKKFFLALASFLIGGIIFFWVARKIGWQEIKSAISLLTGLHGILILVLTILGEIIATWRWKTILKGLNVKASFKELFPLYLASSSLAYYFPISIVGDEMFMAGIIKKKKSISWAKGMASAISDRLLELTFNVIIIFLGIFFFFRIAGFPEGRIEKLYIFLFFLLSFIVFFFYARSFRNKSIVRHFGQNENQFFFEAEKELFSFLKPKNILMWQALGLTLLRMIILVFRSRFLIIFLGGEIGLWAILSILSFTYLSFVFPFPASLGSQDAAQSLVFTELGLGAGRGVAYVLTMRAAEMFVYLFGLIFFLRLSWEVLKTNFFSKIEKLRR